MQLWEGPFACGPQGDCYSPGSQGPGPIYSNVKVCDSLLALPSGPASDMVQLQTTNLGAPDVCALHCSAVSLVRG